MKRVNFKPANLLNPLPVVLVSSKSKDGINNVMTAAWAGTICSDPVMISVSIRKSRFSHKIISETKEFVVNIPNEDLALYTDFVGIYSGKKIDKFNQQGKYKVTKVDANKVKSPIIDECPIALECKVKDIVELGSHDMFIAEVVSCSIDSKYINKDNRIDFKKANLLAYCHGEYYTLGKRIGKFGYSSSKKERNRRTDSNNRAKHNKKD